MQDYTTPEAFLHAVQAAFSASFTYDLAAHAKNRVAPMHLGPGSDIAEDALAHDWTKLSGDLWLNPPYARIEPWVAKCVETLNSALSRRIFVLVPAAVGSNWFANYVDGVAHVVALRPRISFDSVAPYPKDLMLLVYGEIRGGFSTWRWM